jgi:hypothetical protein
MGISNTRTVQNSIDFATFYLGRRPLAVGGASGLEPALTAANIVQQTILAPPFKWAWNRATAKFSQPSVDTPQNLPSFGFIERAYTTTSGGTVNEIANIKLDLTPDAGSGQAHGIGVFLDDNNGNITFRFMPGVPDQSYTVGVVYQKRAPLLTSLNSVWSIPDMFGQVYNYGFTALMELFADDTRFSTMNSKWIGSLLAVAEGLSEQDKAIFMQQWDAVVQTGVYSGQMLQAGAAGRGQ